jgi:hypothetical protein
MKRHYFLTLGFRASAFIAAAAWILTGCADQSAHWHRDGISDRQRAQDYAECRALSQDQSQAGVDQDLAASRTAGSHGPAGEEMPGSGIDTAATRASSEALIACMTDKGYRGE